MVHDEVHSVHGGRCVCRAGTTSRRLRAATTFDRRRSHGGRWAPPQIRAGGHGQLGGEGGMTGKNRAAVLHAPGEIRIEDVPVPVPGAHEVLVEIAAVGVCGSDIHYYEHGRIGPYVVR